MKQSLRVRAEGLRKAEELSIAVFLRFVGQSEVASWALSREAGAELVLKALDPAQQDAGVESHDALVWVADADAPLPGDGRPALRRPLQVEAFGELLRARETRLESQIAPQAIAAASPAPMAPPQPPSAGAPGDAPATHRLLRWPGSEVLQDQRQRKILASFLVARPLSLAQLSALSGVSSQACTDFLQLLAGAGLLDTRQAVAAVAIPAGNESHNHTTSTAASAPQSRSTGTGGLISRLRKRVGLH